MTDIKHSQYTDFLKSLYVMKKDPSRWVANPQYVIGFIDSATLFFGFTYERDFFNSEVYLRLNNSKEEYHNWEKDAEDLLDLLISRLEYTAKMFQEVSNGES